MIRRKDLTGKRFGRLVVIKHDHTDKDAKKSYWLCKCDCGKETIAQGAQLTNRHTKSCGCFRKDRCSKLSEKMPNSQAYINEIYRSYKYGAMARNHEFSLSVEQFRSLISLNCFYCGEAPSRPRKTTNKFGAICVNGIDRIDNSKGYTVENSVPCCDKCNHGKKDYSYSEFVDWIKRVADYMTTKEISRTLVIGDR
jgi:hypothetical protein